VCVCDLTEGVFLKYRAFKSDSQLKMNNKLKRDVLQEELVMYQ